jgi:hypothetical protein
MRKRGVKRGETNLNIRRGVELVKGESRGGETLWNKPEKWG